MEKSLTESQLRNIVFNTIKESLNELSPEFLHATGNEALKRGREGFGKYESPSEIPAGTYHHKKIMQGDRLNARARELEREKQKANGEVVMYESELKEHIFNAIKNGLQSAYDGFQRKEIENPTITDVIEQNGWKIINTSPTQDGGALYKIQQATGAFGNTDTSLSLDELVNDIKEFGKNCIIKGRKNQFEKYSNAEYAIIYIK